MTSTVGKGRDEHSSQIGVINPRSLIEDWQKASTDFVRNYYWLSKGMGIVAQISSVQDTVPIPDEFSTASAMWRQFENNHGGSTELPQPVKGLEISLDTIGNRAVSYTHLTLPTNREV